MFQIIFKSFIKSKVVLFIILLIFLIGVVGIVIGNQFLLKQEKSISQVTTYQKEHIERNLKFFDEEIGYLLYYVRFALINRPTELSALSIGQRDINPSINAVTIRTLEAQKYDTDLSNPANLLSGNLDLGFVIIYLFPLMIIAFTYNLISEEKELGTWRLIAIQSKSVLGYLFKKLGARILIVYLILIALFGTAIISLSIPVDKFLFAFVCLSILYAAFWFATALYVISFEKDSSFNLLTMLSIWILLAILIPAVTNNLVANQYPVPEAFKTFVKQRDSYHEKWDIDKQITLERFYAKYPELKKYKVPESDFNWLVYYAMQQLGDEESAKESESFRSKIELRERLSKTLSYAIPPMHTQLLMGELTKSSLGSHLKFLDSTAAFHEKLRLFFYPKIFGNTPSHEVNWKKFTPKYFKADLDINWSLAFTPLLCTTFVLTMLGAMKVKKLG